MGAREVGVVNVAREEGDRRRRLAAPARADVADEVDQPQEAVVEGRPVLEVEALADLLADLRPAASPRALGGPPARPPPTGPPPPPRRSPRPRPRASAARAASERAASWPGRGG